MCVISSRIVAINHCRPIPHPFVSFGHPSTHTTQDREISILSNLHSSSSLSQFPLQHGDAVALVAGKGRVRKYEREYEKESASNGTSGQDTGTRSSSAFASEKAELIRAAMGGDRVKQFLGSVKDSTLDLNVESAGAPVGRNRAGGVESETAHDRGVEEGLDDIQRERGKAKDASQGGQLGSARDSSVEKDGRKRSRADIEDED